MWSAVISLARTTSSDELSVKFDSDILAKTLRPKECQITGPITGVCNTCAINGSLFNNPAGAINDRDLIFSGY